RALIASAIDVERRGVQMERVRHEVEVCEALQAKFDAEPAFKAAFEALTPGRQRAYHLYFNQAKQEKTRLARVEKFEAAILAGKGMHDGYRQK
ncbi:MAG: YdeI/OmpD-associated family protein, partial [Candidatus Poseidonia sp.]|nr:YdeI/OmpD-associated family protein [Poseidonia sp.]